MKHFLLFVVLSSATFLYADDYEIFPLGKDHILLPYVELNDIQLKRLTSEDDFEEDFDRADVPSVSLRTLMSPVKHQKYRLSCTAFAAIALFEYYNSGNDYSEQCLVKFSSNQDLGHTNQRIDYAVAHGLYQEKDCPYKTAPSGRDTIPELESAALSWPAGGFNYLNTNGASHIAHIRKQLRAGHPVAASIFVAGKEAWKAGEILTIPTQEEIDAECIKTKRGRRCAAHAIVFTGYSKQAGKAYMEFKNSWGDKWGDKGYGKMSYRYFSKMRKSFVISK